jgi:hypothetical protein
MPDFEAAARSLYATPIASPVHSLEELEAAITGLGREQGGGFIAVADFFLSNVPRWRRGMRFQQSSRIVISP